MQSRSLVGLSAMEVAGVLGKDRAMYLTYHEKPYCLVVNIPKSVKDLIELVQWLKQELFNGEN